jgi:hypothetical protein
MGHVADAFNGNGERCVGIPLSLLERLAPGPRKLGNMGDGDVCVFCCGHYTYAVGNDTYNHASSCPWLEARKLIEEAKR